jgi:intracellular multiplication protein IcmB
VGLVSVLSSFLGLAGQLGRKNLSSYCFLETCEDGLLVAKDGSVASLIRIDGTRQMMAEKELVKLCEYANTKLSPYLSRPGHAIQVWFSRDSDASRSMVRDIMRVPQTVSQRLGMNLEDLFEERESHLSKYIVRESLYCVLWTRPSVLTKQELERLKITQKPPEVWPKAVDTQAPHLASRKIIVRHMAFAESFMEDMNSFGIRSKAILGHEAIKAIRASIYPDMTESAWRPRINGDIYSRNSGERRANWLRHPEIDQYDMSHLFAPRLEDQLFGRGGEAVGRNISRIGGCLFGSVDIMVGPQDMLPFSELLNRMRSDEFPWRVSFLIESDGLSSPMVSLKSFLASIGQVTNSDNRTIREAINGLNIFRQEGGVVPRLRTSFATWAPANKLDLIEERTSRLQRAVEGWGYCIATSNMGDPVSGAFSSALGLSLASTAPPGYAPLPDVIYMLPWMRDASPFDSGAVLFRTPDGRPWPFQPGSSEQDSSVDIVYAPPGRGKSVWLNTTNLAFCLSPIATQATGGAKLPLVSIIDIGTSSSGLISLIKEALPPNRRHEAEYRRLRMIREHAINPFDTQLGCRKPLPAEKAFLVNFVSLLGTDPSEDKPPRGLSDLADRAIDEVYEHLSDLSRGGQPRPYVAGENNIVDEAIERYAIKLPQNASWWLVTDKLFAAGAINEAVIAQSYAVPLVEDLVQIVNTPQISDIFGETVIEGGERLIKAFQRVINSCLRAYPILGAPTRFNIGGARVVSLDLDEAAPNAGGGPANKQTAMVYMLARFILCKDFYLVEDNLSEMSSEYRGYHHTRILRIRETPKKIVFDEFHRTATSTSVRSQIIRDMREGRKWGVQIALASQLLGDFDKDMLSLSTGFWIMGVNQEQDLFEAKAKFGLSQTAVEAIPRYLNGPGRGGAPFLAVLQMKDGRHEHLLYNTLGPMELWAFSTTMEDVALRSRLYAKLGPVEARRRLAKRFPGGTAKNEIHRRIVELAEKGGSNAVDASDGVIQDIANEIIGASISAA